MARSAASIKYLRDDLKKRRLAVAAFVFEHKKRPCADCQQTFDPICMDFDHRPGEVKLFTLAHIHKTILNLDKVRAEIAKCDIVCSNCHRIRTHRLRDHTALSRRQGV